MIYIRETIPIKMSGKTSFLISFAYDPKVVDTIKTLPVKQYIKNIQA